MRLAVAMAAVVAVAGACVEDAAIEDRAPPTSAVMSTPAPVVDAGSGSRTPGVSPRPSETALRGGFRLVVTGGPVESPSNYRVVIESNDGVTATATTAVAWPSPRYSERHLDATLVELLWRRLDELQWWSMSPGESAAEVGWAQTTVEIQRGKVSRRAVRDHGRNCSTDPCVSDLVVNIISGAADTGLILPWTTQTAVLPPTVRGAAVTRSYCVQTMHDLYECSDARGQRALPLCLRRREGGFWCATDALNLLPGFEVSAPPLPPAEHAPTSVAFARCLDEKLGRHFCGEARRSDRPYDAFMGGTGARKWNNCYRRPNGGAYCMGDDFDPATAVEVKQVEILGAAGRCATGWVDPLERRAPLAAELWDGTRCSYSRPDNALWCRGQHARIGSAGESDVAWLGASADAKLRVPQRVRIRFDTFEKVNECRFATLADAGAQTCVPLPGRLKEKYMLAYSLKDTDPAEAARLFEAVLARTSANDELHIKASTQLERLLRRDGGR